MFSKLTRLLLPALLWIGVSGLRADITDFYTFSTEQGTYTEIAGTTIPIQGEGMISQPIDIGFTFYYGTHSYTQVRAYSNGVITLGDFASGAGFTINQLAASYILPVIAPFWDNLDMTNGSVQYLLTGALPERVMTIQYQNAEWNYAGNNQFNFQVKLCETGRIEFLYGSSTGTPFNPSASIGITMLPSGSGNYYSVTPGNPATVSSTIENNQITSFPASGTIYAFNPPPPVQDDLQAFALTGNNYPSQGMENTYTVTVRNGGTSPQSNYSVKLMQGTTELASSAGGNIQPLQVVQIPIVWIPLTGGNMQIYGKVVLTGDAYPQNDRTDSLGVGILPVGTVSATVGDGSQQAYMPYDCMWHYSLYETMYYPDEVNWMGMFTGIMFYSNFICDLPDYDISLWMGTTTQTSLADGWIPSTQLTQVFSGNVTIPAGPQVLYLQFQTPFLYMSDNMVLLAKHDYHDVYYTNLFKFFCQTVGTDRSRLYHNDTVNPDPASPPGLGTLSGQFPKTTFIYSITPFTTLQGTVYYNGTPLQGATVSIANTTYNCTTNSIGQYSCPVLSPGTYEVTASKIGYIPQTQTAVVTQSQVTILNFNLLAQPVVTITGQVRGSDNLSQGLPGVTVTLDGDRDYTTATNNLGEFTIPGVLDNSTYQYTISHPRYHSAGGEITVSTTGLDMGLLTLDETFISPHSVTAAQNASHTAVNLQWSAPGDGDWLAWDSGVNSGGCGTGGVDNFAIASRWTAEELIDYAGLSLQAVKFFPRVDAHYWIRVWTGGTAGNPGTLVRDQYVLNESPGQFNTVVLDTPVPIVAGQEIWFGVFVAIYTGVPLGCDAGPAIDGYGNMLFWNNQWMTLMEFGPHNVNWNLAGYIGMQPPALADRSLLGYKVWRLSLGQEGDETQWTLLTPNTITTPAYSDGGWNGEGTPRWAVKAIYTHNNLSPAAFSNTIVVIPPTGAINGFVRNSINQNAIAGAEVQLEDTTYSDLTDPSGFYQINTLAGTYDVSASAAGYADTTFADVMIVSGVPTNLDICLRPLSGTADDTAIPTAWLGCHPNPFRAQTTFRYSLGKASEVHLGIYNLRGQRVRTLVGQTQMKGTYAVNWNGQDEANKAVSQGIYFIRMQAEGYQTTSKVLLLR